MEFWIELLGILTIVWIVWTLYQYLSKWSQRREQNQGNKQGAETNEVDGKSLFDACNITPLPDFDWSTTEPLKFRNFKPKYHITLGISNVPLTSLIQMDKNYLDRLNLRKNIIQNHHETVIQASSGIKPAIDELYTWLVNTYLPTRFPTMFTLSPSNLSLLNIPTSSSIPLIPPSDTIQTLEILGQNLDEEFLVLDDKDGDGYRLKGFVTCFPSGFDTQQKFGMRLRDIHGPVPGYKEKLEMSMDRFFERLEVGKVVSRSNWSITTHGRLFAASGNHLYEGEETVKEDIDLNNTFLRCERQLLHRLPISKAIVFSFKTYLYPIQEIKDEGMGEELAQAIDGLKEGSVPGMHFYKRGVVWGEAVKQFLRS